MIFLCISMVSGLGSLFSIEARKYIKPVLTKFTHSLLSITTFVTGMVSLIYAWYIHKWGKTYDPGYMTDVNMWCLGFITFFSCIGALKSYWYKIGEIIKLFSSNSVQEKDNEKQ